MLAYICDGVPGNPVGTVPTVHAWFDGRSDAKTVNVKQPAGQLQLRLTDAELTGTVTLTDVREVPVAATRAGPHPRGTLGCGAWRCDTGRGGSERL